MQVNILEAKNRLSRLIKSACAGEEIVIAKRGEPVARLVPIGKTPQAGAGSAEPILSWLASHSLPPYAQRPASEIDKGISEERAAWN